MFRLMLGMKEMDGGIRAQDLIINQGGGIDWQCDSQRAGLWVKEGIVCATQTEDQFIGAIVLVDQVPPRRGNDGDGGRNSNLSSGREIGHRRGRVRVHWSAFERFQ